MTVVPRVRVTIYPNEGRTPGAYSEGTVYMTVVPRVRVKIPHSLTQTLTLTLAKP